jgi:hypothetical protein
MRNEEKSMLKYRLLAFLTTLIVTANLAQAESKKGPNGGKMATSHGHPIEFVLKDRDLVFYLTDDDGSPLATKDMRGRATVQDSGNTTTIPLQPAIPNMMVGKLNSPLGPKARVIFSANFNVKGHTHTLTARYVTE